MSDSNSFEDLLFGFITSHIELNEDEKQVILDLNIFRTVKKGEVLLEAGKRSQVGYFVLKGCIRSFYVVDGKEKTTAFYTEMEGHTPSCVGTQEVSSYALVAVEDSVITESTPDMEKVVFEKFPKFERLCRVLSEKLLTKQQIDFDQFKTSSPEQRYLNLLQNRPDLIARVPQYQLASYLGIEPQSLSRLRARIIEKERQ